MFISTFSPSVVKGPRVFLVCPDVPTHWGGYYTIHKVGSRWAKHWYRKDQRGSCTSYRLDEVHEILIRI
jgi:hypothetical protein